MNKEKRREKKMREDERRKKRGKGNLWEKELKRKDDERGVKKMKEDVILHLFSKGSKSLALNYEKLDRQLKCGIDQEE